MAFESWDDKDPNDNLDYDIDWTLRLMSADELDRFNNGEIVVPVDVITNYQVILPSGSITLVEGVTQFTNYFTKVWFSGGTEGIIYQIVNRITTAGGRIMDKTMKLKIKSQ